MTEEITDFATWAKKAVSEGAGLFALSVACPTEAGKGLQWTTDLSGFAECSSFEVDETNRLIRCRLTIDAKEQNLLIRIQDK